LNPSPTKKTSTSPAVEPGGWLVGPWFDALLIANVAWPLLLAAQHGEGFAGAGGLSFWQLYFVTTPHRWITLALVFLDRERFGERRLAFLGVAAAAIAVCIGVRLSTGTLTCLLAIDYIWNAWHFASQHHGIYRIYGRLSEPGRTTGLTLEKWSLRLFLLYAILRIALATWPEGAWDPWLGAGDWIAAATAAGLVCADIARGRNRGGRTLYLVSVCGLYLTALWAVHTRRLGLVLSLATASALFHAIEYLSLVAWSVRRQHAARGSAMGLLGYLAPRWGLALGAFALILGSAGWLLDQGWLQNWLLVNVIVAFCHYAYDGMIWRQRAGSTVRGITRAGA
jgi:hypothetical protein